MRGNADLPFHTVVNVLHIKHINLHVEEERRKWGCDSTRLDISGIVTVAGSHAHSRFHGAVQ